MARPIKEGLEYCSLDTDIFSDRKIRRLLKAYRTEGFTIYGCLLCEIYKDKGYYVQYDDELAFDLSDAIPGVTEQLVNEVITFCIDCGLFDEAVFSAKKVLTSAGIQKRYKKIKEGKKVVIDPEIWVLDRKTQVKQEKPPVSEGHNTQSKVKENKEKEIIDDDKELAVQYGDAVLKGLDNLRADCLKDRVYFVDHVCRQLKITPDTVPKHLDDFNSHLRSIGETVKGVKDYRTHFQSWFRKRKAAEQVGQKQQQALTPYRKANADKYK